MDNIDIIKEIGQNFIDGSYEINTNRAFPNVKDGLKPSQRACLWEMYHKKYFSNKPHVKSAKISGGVIGSWHPHGDTSAYETFVRMSQTFTENIPEVEFHGANGNIILGGDSYASSRYTEARLSPIAEEGMFNGIDKNSVDMIWNYSEDEKWPELLPSVFPRLLVNGSQGIGVGIANNWTCHNFSETANVIKDYINNGNIDYDNYFPDFPTGGTIVNKDELGAINRTGKGRIVVQSSYKISGKTISFYEMPYQVYIEPVIEQIKKGVDSEKILGVKSVLNKSDKKRICLEVECNSSAMPQAVLAQLFAETDLQKQFNANQNGIVSKTPVLLNLKETIDVYLNHNMSCIKREHQFDYDKAVARIHILNGLITAVNNIDEVISIIRNNALPSKILMKKFELDENQVKAILDMRLAKLSKMEVEKLVKEKKEKEELAEYCKKVVNSENEQKKILVKRLDILVSKYGKERRTKVIQKDTEKAANNVKKKTNENNVETVIIDINNDGYIKAVMPHSYRRKKDTKFSMKSQTSDTIMIFTSLGKIYRIPVKQIKKADGNSKGTALGAILELKQEEKIMYSSLCDGRDLNDYIFFATKNGRVKKADISEYCGATKNTRGTEYFVLSDDDTVVFAQESEEGSFINISTRCGYKLSYKDNEIGYQGKKSRGVSGINLSNEDYIEKCCITDSPMFSIKKRTAKGSR